MTIEHNEQQPAAAQEAVAVVDGPDRGASISSTATLIRAMPSGTKLYAAPVTAAPADVEEDAYVIEQTTKLLAEIAVIVNGPEPAGTRWSYHDLPAKVRALAGTPAAPGIDLTPFKMVAKFAKYWADEVGNDEVDAAADRLLALIYASPKGDHFPDATKMVGSPKGGSEARDALRVAYRHLDVESLRVSHCNDLAIIQAAMQASDAEVRP